MWNSLGLTLKAQGHFEEAVDAYDQALRIRKAELGEAHADVAQTMNNRALALKAAGHFDAAASEFEATAEVMASVHGPGHRRTSSALKRASSSRRMSLKSIDPSALPAE